MPQDPATVKAALGELEKTGKAGLQIHFPDIVITKPGTQTIKAATQPAPFISISSRIAKSKPTKYFSMCLDLDAPLPSFNFMSPILHEMQANLTGQGEPDAEGWIKLASDDEKPIAHWAPPGPPPFSSPHRYIFMIWEQSEDLASVEIRKRLGFGETVGLRPRPRWDQDACEKKLGLGKSLGSNYFTV
ncbi:phosphatidylethanolamine-binding protein [Clohesyomyces aquaticus]|uniref:Phosphatidylethanolamine-binding protein n=1 Tax=Clohesyomyces aquaticus TaxID=1231657 RepID=A0A1Y1ZEP4_9PLEO|nr:phosphatidylethanolamine-binding protein [Clohesyomyces aquaticus]